VPPPPPLLLLLLLLFHLATAQLVQLKNTGKWESDTFAKMRVDVCNACFRRRRSNL
jgi:hypothetical protein